MRDGATPKVAVDPDVTPIATDRCSCGAELIMVDGDENPPLTQTEINVQFHCLMSRSGWWFFCMTQGATWLKHSPEAE